MSHVNLKYKELVVKYSIKFRETRATIRFHECRRTFIDGERSMMGQRKFKE